MGTGKREAKLENEMIESELKNAEAKGANDDNLRKQLDLAVKALEWYADYKNFAYAGMNEMYACSMAEKAKSTLEHLGVLVPET